MIAGTHRLWLGPIPKPRRVRVAFHERVEVADLANGSDALAELIDRRVWPAVQEASGCAASADEPQRAPAPAGTRAR